MKDNESRVVQGRRLKELRKARGLTQQQVAEALNITHSAYGHYEAGRAEPPMSVVPALSRVLGVTPGALFGEEEPIRSTRPTRGDHNDVTDEMWDLLPLEAKRAAIKAALRLAYSRDAADERATRLRDVAQPQHHTGRGGIDGALPNSIDYANPEPGDYPNHDIQDAA